MSIDCRSMYEDIADSIGQTYGVERLQGKFVRACNMALDDMSFDADLSANISHIATIDDTISGLDDAYGHVLYAGIMYFLVQLGVRPADPKMASIVFADTERRWTRFKGQYARSIDNDIQPDQDTASMGDIGYLQAET